MEPKPPRRPPLSSRYTITVMTDELCTHPDSTASRITIGASTYRGKSNAWLQEMGHRQTVFFTNGESFQTRLNQSFAHLILDKTSLWTLLILDQGKQYISEFVKDGEWDHVRLHQEATKSRSVVLYLQFQEDDELLDRCFNALAIEDSNTKVAKWIEDNGNETSTKIAGSQRSVSSVTSTKTLVADSSSLDEMTTPPPKHQSASVILTIHLRYTGQHIGGSVRPPVLTVVSQFNYDSIVNAVSKSYPYQVYVKRAAPGSIKCVGFMLENIFFSCELTMEVAMKGAVDKYTLDMLLADEA